MKRVFEKPEFIIMSETIEGVFAASGAGSGCWSISVRSSQAETDWHTFRVDLRHAADHSSSSTTVTLTFSSPIQSAEAQGYPCNVNGNTVTITRALHANGNDNANYEVKVVAADPALTRGLTCTSYSVSCTHS